MPSKEKRKKERRKKSSQFNSGTRSFTKSIASNGQRRNHWYDRVFSLSQASSLLHLIREPDTFKPGASPLQCLQCLWLIIDFAWEMHLDFLVWNKTLKFKARTLLRLVARGIHSCDGTSNITYPT